MFTPQYNPHPYHPSIIFRNHVKNVSQPFERSNVLSVDCISFTGAQPKSSCLLGVVCSQRNVKYFTCTKFELFLFRIRAIFSPFFLFVWKYPMGELPFLVNGVVKKKHEAMFVLFLFLQKLVLLLLVQTPRLNHVAELGCEIF